MNRFFTVCATIGFAAAAASADSIPDRTTLEGLLGGNGTLEDFETLDIPFNGQRSDTSGLLNSNTTFDGSGPGLVQPGADYVAGSLWWNGDGYFELETQTLGDCTGWREFEITIEYTTPVNAMGIDIQPYSGFGNRGIISVYDTGDNLVTTENVVNGQGFFGWEHAPGIGKVVVDANVSGDYILIDNHLYGEAGPADCLNLENSGYIGGQPATWTVSGGTPGQKAVVVYGFNAGNINLNEFSAAGRLWCAEVGIAAVNPSKIVGNPKIVDANGEAVWTKTIPLNQVGNTILTQALGSDTCPDDCQSDVDSSLVQ